MKEYYLEGLTIIVPVYNEEENIERVHSVLKKYTKEASMPVHVLFVDDGSKDKSYELLTEVCQHEKNMKLISLVKNCGLSAAIKAGFDSVETVYTGYLDADLQTTPEDFERLIPFLEEYNLVTGFRADRQDRFVKKMSSTIANSIRRFFTNDGMDDTGCPLKILHTDYAKRIPMFKGLHRFLPAMILLQQGKVKQVSIRHYPRIAGQAKYGLWNRLLGPLSDCFAFVWMKRKYINYEIKEDA